MGDGINSLQCFIQLLKPWLVISGSERNSFQADFPALLLSHWSKWTYNSWHHIRCLPFLVQKRFRNSLKDHLFEVSSGPESLKIELCRGLRYICLHVHTIPHAHILAAPAGDTRKHKSNMLINKNQEKLSIQHHVFSSPHSARNHQSWPSQLQEALFSALDHSLGMHDTHLLLTTQGNMR